MSTKPTITTEHGECCVDFCQDQYQADSTSVVNKYKCGGRKLARADMWQITNSKKTVSFKTFPVS